MKNIYLRLLVKINEFTLKRIRADNKYKHHRWSSNFVSGHALLRYIERVEGYDVEGLRTMILEKVEPLSKANGGTGKFTVDGITYVVDENIIKTAYPHIPTKPVSIIGKGKEALRKWTF